jgi:AcrR family transcriptional regulator
LHKKAMGSESLRPSQRAVQREDTRRRLLAAARKLFRARGVEQVSMEDIAAAAAASRATIYLYFAGKPALLEALLEEDWAAQVRLFERLGSIDVHDRDQLGGWVLRVAEGMRKARDSFGIHWAALGQNPALTARHHEHRGELAKILLSAMQDAAAEGNGGLAREVEAELIVAELEHFATASAMGWSDDQAQAALPLVVARLRGFASLEDTEIR